MLGSICAGFDAENTLVSLSYQGAFIKSVKPNIIDYYRIGLCVENPNFVKRYLEIVHSKPEVASQNIDFHLEKALIRIDSHSVDLFYDETVVEFDDPFNNTKTYSSRTTTDAQKRFFSDKKKTSGTKYEFTKVL